MDTCVRTIGNLEDARKALELCDTPSWNLPDGWQYLGNGMYRWVVASPEGIAYKVSSAHRIQRNEFNNCTRHASKEWAVPCSLWELSERDLVIAMPMINGLRPPEDNYSRVDVARLTQRQRELLRDAALFIGDLHVDNVRLTEDGGLKVIDAGG